MKIIFLIILFSTAAFGQAQDDVWQKRTDGLEVMHGKFTDMTTVATSKTPAVNVKNGRLVMFSLSYIFEGRTQNSIDAESVNIAIVPYGTPAPDLEWDFTMLIDGVTEGPYHTKLIQSGPAADTTFYSYITYPVTPNLVDRLAKAQNVDCQIGLMQFSLSLGQMNQIHTLYRAKRGDPGLLTTEYDRLDNTSTMQSLRTQAINVRTATTADVRTVFTSYGPSMTDLRTGIIHIVLIFKSKPRDMPNTLTLSFEGEYNGQFSCELTTPKPVKADGQFVVMYGVKWDQSSSALNSLEKLTKAKRIVARAGDVTFECGPDIIELFKWTYNAVQLG